MKKKKVMAIIVIVFLVLMYVTDLILALCGHPDAKQYLLVSLALTFVIPILLYGFLVLAGRNKREYEEEVRRALESKEDEEKEASSKE